MKRSQSAPEDVSPALVAPTGESGEGGAGPPADIHPVTIHLWAKQGLLRLALPGSGGRRDYLPGEVRAARALDSLRHLAGVTLTPESSGGLNARRRALQLAVAEAARANPPGTVVELPTPAPWLRIVLVVPE